MDRNFFMQLHYIKYSIDHSLFHHHHLQAMDLSINGQSQVPPGFRFHPTEEELLHYYLRKKVAVQKIDLDVIQEVDLNKLEPWDIQEKCRIGSTPQNDWYFFSHKDKKYPTGTRTNRATAAGFWKATGRDKIIYSSFNRIGLRKTLVFYKGRAPHGQKSDWIMHEYRLDDSNVTETNTGEVMGEEGWVVCRVFKKKNYQKTLDSPRSLSTTSKLQMLCGGDGDGAVLDQILSYMGQQRTNSCKMENESVSNKNILDQLQQDKSTFMHLPRLDSPNLVPHYDPYQTFDEMLTDTTAVVSSNQPPPNWVALDRLVASQLNCQAGGCGCFDEVSLNDNDDELQISRMRLGRGNQSLNMLSSDSDLWSNFTVNSVSSTSSDPLRHWSV